MRPNWLLILVIIIAAFFRLYQLPDFPPGLYPDEAMNGNNALEALATNNFKVFYPENNGREGVFINIQALFLSVFGMNEPWVLRLPSAIFGILTVLALYFLAKELFNKRIALLSSFFMATAFWHINFSRIGFRAILAPLLLTLALYFLLVGLRNAKNSGYVKYFFALIAGAIYGLGSYTYIAYRATPLLVLFVVWLFAKQYGWRAIFKPFLIFLAAAFIVSLPIFVYFAQNPADFLGRTGQVSVFNSPAPVQDLAWNLLKTLGQFNISGDWNWRHNFAGAPLLYWPVGVFLLIGVIASIIQKRWAILSVWLFVAALPVIISNEGLPHALRSILMAPPVFIFAGIGGAALYGYLERRTDRKLLFSTAMTILVIFMLHTHLLYFKTWGMRPNTRGAFAENYVQIGRRLNSLPKELPKYVIVKADGVLVRGIPMPSQTVMFITDTFTPEKQREKNIFYVLFGQPTPPGAFTVVIE